MSDLETPHDCVIDLTATAHAFAAEMAGRVERKKKALAAPDGIQMFLLYVRANGSVPTHQVSGPITVQTLIGDPKFEVAGQWHDLPVGSVISAAAGAPHALSAASESVLLVTHALKN